MGYTTIASGPNRTPWSRISATVRPCLVIRVAGCLLSLLRHGLRRHRTKKSIAGDTRSQLRGFGVVRRFGVVVRGFGFAASGSGVVLGTREISDDKDAEKRSHA
jgi:hypothetical protein